MKQYSVKLRIFKGKKTYLNDKGDLDMSNSQACTITPYGGMEWENFMKHVLKMGNTSGEVVNVQEIVHTEKKNRDGNAYMETTYVDVKEGAAIIAEIAAVVKDAFDNTVKVVLTPDQKKMAAMEAEMAEMREMLKDKPAAEVKEVETPKEEPKTGNDSNELSMWRDKYKKIFGKKAFAGWSAERIEEKIEEHGNK